MSQQLLEKGPVLADDPDPGRADNLQDAVILPLVIDHLVKVNTLNMGIGREIIENLPVKAVPLLEVAIGPDFFAKFCRVTLNWKRHVFPLSNTMPFRQVIAQDHPVRHPDNLFPVRQYFRHEPWAIFVVS